MPDFNIDDVLGKFNVQSKDAPKADFDIDSILSEFGGKPEPMATNAKAKAITVRPVAPPISNATQEQSDLINSQPSQQGGANPRSSLPTTSIQESAYDADVAGKQMFSSGVEDFQSGHPYKGAGKAVLGAAQRVLSPVTGLIEGGVGTPVTDITGNKDIGDRAAFVAGAALPVVPGANYVAKALPKTKALSALVENIGRENLPGVVAAMKANPRLAPADLSPRVLQDAQNLFTLDGPQIDYLARTSAQRMATAKDSVNTAFDASMGATVNAAKKVDDLKKAAQEIGKKNIEPVLANQPHTDVTDLIKFIDGEIGSPAMKAIKAGTSPPLPLTPYQRELLTVRDKLRSTDWPDRDKMFAYTDQVHDAQIVLREKAQSLVKSATGSEQYTGKQLLGFREKMKDAVGKDYKEALSKYAGQKKVEEAFHYGHEKILAKGKSLDNDPSFFEKWVNSPSRKPGELEAAKEGARLAINAEINGTRSAATNPASRGTNIAQVDFNRQRLATLLGKDEADKLLTKLEHTRMEANTHNKIFEGSQTAMRSASKSQFSMPTATEVLKSAPAVAAAEASNFFMGGVGGMGTGLLVAAKAGAIAKDMVRFKLAREHNAQYAKLALPTEGPSRDALIKSLEAAIPGPKLPLLRRGASSLSRLVAP